SAFVGEHRADSGSEVGGERELAAGVHRDLRRVGRGAGGDRLVLVDALEAKDVPGEEEGVADGQRLDEALLDLAEDAAAAPGEGMAAVTGDAHIEVGRFDDRPDVEAVL